MTYRAGVVRNDPLGMGVEVAIGRLPEGGEGPMQVVTGITSDGVTHEVIPANAAAPTLRIPDEVARPLLDALANHYGGTSDSRTLRRDYEAERARVDKLIDAAIQRGAA